MRPIVELAVRKDIPALTVLEQICFNQDRISAKQFRYFIAQKTSDVVVMRYRESLIGCAVILFRKNSKIARLYSFALDLKFRDKGWAKILYDFIETSVCSHHCHEIRLEVREDNERAIVFYKKRGFVIFDQYPNFYEDQQPALRMRKIVIA